MWTTIIITVIKLIETTDNETLVRFKPKIGDGFVWIYLRGFNLSTWRVATRIIITLVQRKMANVHVDKTTF